MNYLQHIQGVRFPSIHTSDFHTLSHLMVHFIRIKAKRKLQMLPVLTESSVRPSKGPPRLP